jgi:hypothetical protein
MPDWTTQGGPNAGHDPEWKRKIAICLGIAVALAAILIRTGIIG